MSDHKKRDELNRIFDQLPTADQDRLISMALDRVLGPSRRQRWRAIFMVAEVTFFFGTLVTIILVTYQWTQRVVSWKDTVAPVVVILFALASRFITTLLEKKH
jgi:hypothetical protein